MLLRFASALPVLFFASAASACGDTESFLFSCAAGEQRTLALCGTEEDLGDGPHFTGVRFVLTSEKGEELSYPANPADGPAQLFFSHQFKAGLYQASVRFERDGASYRLLYRDGPEDNPDGASGGLEIIRDGKIEQTIACSEPPSFYFDQTRALLACDMSNPFGAAGCSSTVPAAP